MTTRRAVFLDFDGTLGEYGVVPPAHVQAIADARARGHAMFLCTGRPISMVPADIQAALDGVVGSAGCYITVGGEVLQDIRFPDDIAARTLEALLRHDVPFVLESPDGAFGTPEGTARLHLLMESFGLDGAEVVPGSLGRGAPDILDAVRTPASLGDVSFAKAVMWASHVPAEQLADEISPDVRPMPNSIASDGTNSGELQLWAVDKIDGVRAVARHLGLPMENTVACGDGLNDVDMLRAAGASVVIEASSAAREVKDPTLVVPGPGRAGLVGAFEKLGLFA